MNSVPSIFVKREPDCLSIVLHKAYYMVDRLDGYNPNKNEPWRKTHHKS